MQRDARLAAVQVATLNAAHVPLHTATMAVEVMELAVKCARHGNLNAISDAMSGAVLAQAALRAASYNVRLNLMTLEDKTAAEKMLGTLADLEQRAEHIGQEVQIIARERAQLI